MARVLYMATSAAEEDGGERFGCEVACGGGRVRRGIAR